MAGNSPDAGRSVLSRALAVLGAFTSERPEQPIGSIAQVTGLAPATVHRLLAELVEWGAVERVGRGRYRIGIRLWQVGSLAPAARDLRDAALPFLQDLCSATGHYVHLAVLDGHQAVFVERLTGRIDTMVRSRVGKRAPLYASGPGKVLLAHAPPEFVAEVVAMGLPRLASGTITDPRRLARQLAEIRATGYCLTRDEITEGAASVAAPIVLGADQVVAALSVVAPSDSSKLGQLVPVVRVAAGAVSRALDAQSRALDAQSQDVRQDRLPLSERKR